MRICIPTENENGIDSLVYGHFGSAPCFAVFDTNTKKVELITNGNSEHVHGQCNPVQPLIENKVDIVAVAGMGMRALDRLNYMGIKVYHIQRQTTIKEFIEDWQNETHKEMTVEDSCNEHKCD